MKKKQIVDSPDELKLKHLEESIAVIGIFESKGKYFPDFGKKYYKRESRGYFNLFAGSKAKRKFKRAASKKN